MLERDEIVLRVHDLVRLAQGRDGALLCALTHLAKDIAKDVIAVRDVRLLEVA